MPFDNADFTTTTRSLTDLGITPVPYDVVRRHEKMIVRRFLRDGGHREVSFFWRRWALRNEYAEWFTNVIGDEDNWINYRNVTEALSSGRFGLDQNDPSPAPQPLIDLAVYVERRVKDAIFSIDWFADDPILNVTIRGEESCLGIWDKGVIVALAGQNGAEPLVPPPSRWRKLAAVFFQ